jgi:hypothetical protein
MASAKWHRKWRLTPLTKRGQTQFFLTPSPTLLRHFNKVARVDLNFPSLVQDELRYCLLETPLKKPSVAFSLTHF